MEDINPNALYSPRMQTLEYRTYSRSLETQTERLAKAFGKIAKCFLRVNLLDAESDGWARIQGTDEKIDVQVRLVPPNELTLEESVVYVVNVNGDPRILENLADNPSLLQ